MIELKYTEEMKLQDKLNQINKADLEVMSDLQKDLVTEAEQAGLHLFEDLYAVDGERAWVDLTFYSDLDNLLEYSFDNCKKLKVFLEAVLNNTHKDFK